MGKKRHRKTKTSKGLRSSISRSLITATHQAVANVDKMMNKVDAWLDGKNPWITVSNPVSVPDRPFIKVRANSLWGDPRSRYNIYMKKEKNASSILQR